MGFVGAPIMDAMVSWEAGIVQEPPLRFIEEPTPGNDVRVPGVNLTTRARFNRAVMSGDTALVRQLVTLGHEIDGFDNAGFTSLHYAVFADALEVISILVAEGANINAGSLRKNQTAVHWAVKLDRRRCLSHLATHGASLNERDSTSDGKAPIHVAVKYGQLQMALMLLEMGVSVDFENGVGETPLFQSTVNNDIGFVTALIKMGANVNARNRKNSNTTPLHVAVANRRLRITNLLLCSGADMTLTCSRYKQTPLHCAAKQGTIQILEMMHSFRANLSLPTGTVFGDHPIHLAVEEDRLAVLDWLLSKQVSVDSRNKQGYTPLHVASHLGHADTVSFLLKRGAQINLRTTDQKNFTALDIASFNNKIDVVELLIQHGADPNAETSITKVTPLHHAASRDHVECLKALVRHGGNISTNIGMEDGETLIRVAVKHGCENVTRWLINSGMLSEGRDLSGKSPLHYATYYGHINLVRLFLKLGMDVNSEDDFQRTPIHYAVLQGHVDITGLLITWKANVNIFTYYGFAPVHFAAYSSKPYCMELLSSHGCNILTPTTHDFGDLPIHIAAAQGNKEVVLWLLGKGVPVDIKNSHGFTALFISAVSGRYNMTKLLLEEGADVNIKVARGGDMTPLHSACATGNMKLVDLFVSKGADLNVLTSTDGRTPLHWAGVYGQSDVVRFLLQVGADFRVRDSEGNTALSLHLKHFQQMARAIFRSGDETLY